MSINYIAKLNNTDGNADPSWNPNPNNQVWGIAIHGSDIYTHGTFTLIGDATRNYIAKLNNTDGNADPSWNPNPNQVVRSIAISGSDIYVGGNFTSIGIVAIKNIAKLKNTDGTANPSWNPNPNQVVRSIAISGSDIYVGGGFTSIGGATRNRIAKLNISDGTADPNWNPNANNTVWDIAIYGSNIYVGGDFSQMDGEDQLYFAQFTIPGGTITFNLKTILEGPYASPNMSTALDLSSQLTHPYSSIHSGTESVANAAFFASNPDIVDWVVVELRIGEAASTKVASRAAFLKADGSIVDLDGISDLAFKGLDPLITSYYIVVHHRNHLPIMSANLVPIY